MKPQTLKGFRDFLPEEMAVRSRVRKILTDVFESYGFEPLETPTLEYQSVLLEKYGKEVDKLVYTFEDKGGRKVGMRYDLTVPLARVAAANQNNLPTPFKRYQIQPVWRADKPQKGRYREIQMCDIDILNSSSPLSDAEILAVISSSLKKLGLKDFTIRVNSRSILFAILEEAKVEKNQLIPTLQSLDKLDKLSDLEVKSELREKKKLSQPVIDQIFEVINELQQLKVIRSKLAEGDVLKIPFEKIQPPINELKSVLKYAYGMGVSPENIVIDLFLSRGLDYYTGSIFETIVTQPKIGSITGGGRYDRLIKQLGGPDWPAVGTTFGLDRICDTIIDNQLWPKIKSTVTNALMTTFNQQLVSNSLSLARELRDQGINTELYPDPEVKLDKQLKYADRKGIPYVVILGPDEVAKGVATVKNMKTGDQKSVPLAELPKVLHD